MSKSFFAHPLYKRCFLCGKLIKRDRSGQQWRGWYGYECHLRWCGRRRRTRLRRVNELWALELELRKAAIIDGGDDESG